ncbi:hypothetical protein FCIRC_7607 [Fusarium circinatum]|uniref:Uncharacterized protein n=1 Tax=Fusarium circinatum TaxID=48490 RepID=A0A8H5TTY1_FUSCI|nr:hypothetical protein FCIRC_7607 [Fusarium circinatum]
MATPEEAERTVKEVTEYYGYLDHDMMDDIGRFNSDYRRRIDENWLKMENAASHSIKVLARNIYGSGARFVFELLQNAEDNSFRKADDKNDPPFISFQIHPKYIVVECNEDGFTSLDLKAICSVPKALALNIAASRVHIQSGNYSFEFRHNRNDPGLGMFDDLQETCLLFLRKLSKISVTFYDGQGNLQRSKQFTKKKIDDFRVSLETTVASADISSMTSQTYHITKQLATGLAQSESRDAATIEEARQSLTSAEVVLEFPLKSDYQPHISTRRQELFAFLPLRTSDYKFHIQSDFDTNANRQDIVTTTRRNLNIRDWIAKTFLQAILEFNQHPVLCYNWPLFLPSQDGGHDSFWSGLDDKILSLVQDNHILRSRNRSDLRLVREVMIASNGMVDDEGILLLGDPVEDPFISAKYPYKVTKHLEPYGLQVASTRLFILLLKRDLGQHDSKMRANTTADDWHSSVARLCSKICDNGWNGTTLLKSLEVLPLRDGKWSSCLKVLSKSATTNPDRRDFFRHLGAAEATFEEVRSMIFSSFVQGSELYLKCSEHTIYMPDDQHPFSPASLLKDTRVPTDFDVHFLWLGYFTIAHEDQKKKTMVFRKWLCDFIGIQERLTILSPNKKELSQPFQYVLARYPSKFLGLFEHLWRLEGNEVLKHRSILSRIKQIPAKKLCKVNFSLKLENTWLPLPELRGSVRRYMEYPEKFPFLITRDDGDAEQISSKWSFLSKHFSVGMSSDLDFLLKILHCIYRSCEEPVTILQSQRVFELYIAIYAKLSVSPTPSITRTRIKEFFESDEGVFILAPYTEESSAWTELDTCVWDAPYDLDSVYSLKSGYKRRGLSDEDIGNIENLFLGTLGIHNISAEGIVSELECRRWSCGDEECDGEILSLYKYLHEELTVTPGVRAAFEQSPLIFLRQDDGPKWYKTSDCLWSSTAPIRGKVTLDETYEDLKELFVAKLGVKSLTMQMVYDELRQSPESSVEDIKVALFSFNDFLQIEDGNCDPEPIRAAKVFPVVYPDGTTALRSMDVGFAIADRGNLRSKFSDQIALLDFELEGVHRLRPLFSWLKIQERYLSRCVMERTAVSGDSRSPISSPKRDLGLKAYQICRVAATFRSPRFQHGDPHLYCAMEITQDQKAIRSVPQSVTAHISGDDLNFTIYVAKDKKKKIFLDLPRVLEEWLRKDRDRCHTFEVISSLTSIVASDIFVLDEILEDQGIIELPFENNGTSGTKRASEGASECLSVQEVVGKPSEEDQGESLVLRGRESASEVEDQDEIM